MAQWINLNWNNKFVVVQWYPSLWEKLGLSSQYNLMGGMKAGGPTKHGWVSKLNRSDFALCLKRGRDWSQLRQKSKGQVVVFWNDIMLIY